MKRHYLKAWGLSVLLLAHIAFGASDYDELKVKREPVFDFAQKPAVSRSGDKTTIAFATKGYCDVTVAIENSQGRIIRHLASGVLGKNAPAPFLKNSKRQRVIWDGKNDQGKYVDDKASHSIRVSLGLKPQFEKTLYWSPKKRVGAYPPLICATEEGVFVCEGRGVDHIRQFDHQGKYVRTVYPFPANKLNAVQGLKQRKFPQDGKTLPVKLGFVQATLLTCGTSSAMGLPYKFGDGFGASAMAVKKGRIALAHLKLNRLATDGSTGNRPLEGGKTTVTIKRHRRDMRIIPSSAAFSPDGKTLYLAGYFWKEPRSYMYNHYCLPVVMKMDYEGNADAVVFTGAPALGKAGTGNDQFKAASSVAVDEKGRVYVADYPNDRVQIFAPDGKFLKTIKTPKPAQVRIHPKTGEIWVLSWMVPSDLVVNVAVAPKLTIFGPFDDPKQLSSAKLPLKAEKLSGYVRGYGLRYSIELVVNDKEPAIWLVGPKGVVTKKLVSDWGMGVIRGATGDKWLNSGIGVMVKKGKKWDWKTNFAKEAAKDIVRVKPAAFARQRLYVNPLTGRLYVADETGFGKSFIELLEINPGNWKYKIVNMPFDSEDLAFDLNGMAYLRTDTIVARFDSRTWREIPWDYGETRKKVGFSSLGVGKNCNLLSALATPGQRPVFWHQGGMWVNAKGHLAVCCCSRAQTRKRQPGVRFRAAVQGGKPYAPAIFPGRVRWQEIHVWDRHGKLVHEDALPGIGINDGLGLDKDDNLYLMAANCRLFNGKRYENIMTGTIMKFPSSKGRVLGTGKAPVLLPKEEYPKRPPDFTGFSTGNAWAEGAEWLYGGVGYSGMIMSTIGYGCCCWNARMGFDYFARTFAPEIDHYSIAVLDSAGNLILRIGKYGNVDDGKALDPKGGPLNARSIGGDEVGLFHACYLASHTDRRLFVADSGNARLLSIKLGYHVDEKIALKDVKDQKL